MVNDQANFEQGSIDLQALEESLMQVENRDLSSLTAEEQYDLIVGKVAKHPEAVTPKPTREHNELLERLRESKETGRPLVVKFGIDPTGPDMHLGHAISVLMLRRFQQMGHEIKFIVGDFTAKIGDPAERSKERIPLTEEQIQQNLKSYFHQASLILNIDSPNVEVVHNSEWLSQVPMTEWIQIFQQVSASQMFQRQDFQNRIANGGSVSLAELVYSLFMAYDSVALNPDIELGGIDQFVNLHWCRELMGMHNQRREIFVTVDLLPGTTGEVDAEGRFAKMSKSFGNYIQVLENPSEMYAKVMSVPDEIMWLWYRELTEISSEQLQNLREQVENGNIHPMDCKKTLARLVVGTFNHFDREVITEAETAFSQRFGKTRVLVPDDAMDVTLAGGQRILDIVRGLTKRSGRELKDLAQSGAISRLVGEEYVPISPEELVELSLDEDTVIKVGKRNYFRITVDRES